KQRRRRDHHDPHGRRLIFGVRLPEAPNTANEQVNALGLTLTDTSSSSVQFTAQPTQPQSSHTMMEEIVRVVQAMMEHYIPPDIRVAAGPFQLPTFSQQGSVPPTP
ncbi:hypothetical protein Dimus_015394, partial [Dionaea muscipula]